MRIVEADLALPEHQREVLLLTEAYARDAMGNGSPLPADVLARLIPGLRAHPTTLVLLAYLDRDSSGEPATVGSGAVGIATCFLGFSTFAARPLLNIHDLAVLPPYRGEGIGRALLEAVETKARERGCVKLTLEVLESNPKAKQIYQAAGFSGESSSETGGPSLFYTKSL